MPLSQLTIGYGPTTLQRRRFGLALHQGQNVAIAHLRVYLSSCPAPFESMIRKFPPFSDYNERASDIDSKGNIFPQDWWMVKTTTFIIHA